MLHHRLTAMSESLGTHALDKGSHARCDLHDDGTAGGFTQAGAARPAILEPGEVASYARKLFAAQSSLGLGGGTKLGAVLGSCLTGGGACTAAEGRGGGGSFGGGACGSLSERTLMPFMAGFDIA